MGQAVAERTILRKTSGSRWETWGEVAHRVALGNSLLTPFAEEQESEYEVLSRHIANASLLLSGRHLQHGDATQPSRNFEVFSNCSTSAASFITFYLLLNGSGVGRAYDDDMMLVDWDYAPHLRIVLDTSHPDFDWGRHESTRDAHHKYVGDSVIWFRVPDSREGWAKAVELWERLAFERIHQHKTLVLDFSSVRAKGSPIRGMQNRPASGPVPLMDALAKCATVRGAGMEPWRQAIYLDHYLAECVLVGGARRAARMSTKYWRDRTVLDFIQVKRPIEFLGKTVEEITAIRSGGFPPMPFLWSSNNSVGVDEEFWRLVKLPETDPEFFAPDTVHARAVLDLIVDCSYGDGTGEPGLINLHKLVQHDDGIDAIDETFVGSRLFKVEPETTSLIAALVHSARQKTYYHITNPCGEISINLLGGYCVIADVVPFFAASLDEAEEAFRAATRALMRVNLMDSLYGKEVARTNRIGVGMTGVHEFAWKFFGLGFRDLLDEVKAKDFWLTLARFNRAVRDESVRYARKLGVAVPHTSTTIKPAGTTSKLFGLTEGWHLPSMAWYLRWVQFRTDDPLVEQYRAAGYPTKELKSYSGTTVVGFPTEPTLAGMGLGDKLVLAAEATPEEQYQWLMLGEKYWIHGTDAAGDSVREVYGNQISYTLKYDPEVVSLEEFREMLVRYQSEIRCCSVMPQVDTSVYEYQPEQPLDADQFEALMEMIDIGSVKEDIGFESLACAGMACPVDFREDKDSVTI
jgi:hypothetical protein